MLTIVIPVYNAKHTIVDTLKSLMNQNNNNFKVIIIDDGSNDNSKELIEGIIRNDRRFELYTQDNYGVSFTRNKGINLCDTKYIAFLDADDLYKKDFVSGFYENCKGYPDVIAYKNPNNINFFSIKLTSENYLKHKNTPDTNCWIISTKLLHYNKIYFDEDISWGEDMLFFYTVLSRAYNIVYINKVATITNDTSESLSKKKYDSLDCKFVWLEKLKTVNDNKLISIIDGYLRNGTIVNAYFNKEIQLEEALTKMKKINFSNNLRSFKLNFFILKMKFENYRRRRRI